ncbi:flagellar hook protein FlgE [Sulfuricystis multivorans]|uniref:flagellar hook protein FlgE n=1 Tax=Sulfuricystis multivorans TaxID=2211108 RepID=UPI000F8257BA|nr:flagellar hook protein FlgE [Sulfuricystis multivorans]
MSFQQGLSGLNASSKAIDVVGNNIANSGTVGFKAANTAFADVFAATMSGINQIGIGTSIASINQQFTQGNITVTNNPLDLAINGQGFFRLSNNGAITWTRNGQFNVDKDGYIVNANGYRLTGYLANAQNVIVPSTPAEIYINTSDLQPQATGSSPSGSGLQMGLNLDSRADVITAAFDINDPTTYTSSTSATVYDSLGNAHLLSLYFVKTAANSWNVYSNLDGGTPSAATAIAFDATGKLTSPANGLISQSHAVTTGATSPLAFNLDLTGSTQYGNIFGVNSITQDGYASGRLTGLSVAVDGTIQGRYSNGQTRDLAQVVLGNFNNPNGLVSLGNNQWGESADSGQPLIGVPGSGSLGVIQSAAVEESNVDLTAELVNMITYQRQYQANAQTIKTQDSILQTLVNLR